MFQYGANVAGGSAGATIAATFTPTGASSPTFAQTPSPCGPLTANPNFCARSPTFDLNKLNGTWQLQIAQGGSTTTAILPSASVIPVAPVPFPADVTIAAGATGTTPTIGWALPSGLTPNGFRINIYNRSTPLLANGTHDTIYSHDLADPTATSFALPAGILTAGSNYTIGFQVIETRNNVPFSGAQSEILTRSNSFFDFSPTTVGSPPVIALPTVNGLTGVYTFKIRSVGPSTTTFIDPAIATGYHYQTAAGEPNFASVLLPNVANGMFTLSYAGSLGATTTQLAAGVQYFFPSGGVSAFDVTGIDPAAGLDPANTLAFVTGLTFASNGSFDGTVTPITTNVDVAEPASAAILGIAGLFAGAVRRRGRSQVERAPAGQGPPGG